ncbi:MAG: alpha/beta hydrolase family protein [Candidatus Ratteibacteria bacterium]
MLNTLSFVDKKYEIELDGRQYSFILRCPDKLSKRPVLLITIAADCYHTLNHSDYNLISNMFLAAGHLVASFDLPNHGEHVDNYGEGLTGWANAMSDGVDIFEKIKKIGSSIIDLAAKEKLAWKNTIVMSGVSRGGLSAMHIMAYDERVYATVVHAPCTDLSKLREFEHLKDNPILVSANAINLARRLANKFLLIAIGEKDQRVDEQSCFEFYARLFVASDTIKPDIFTLEGETHGKTAFNEAAYIAGTSFLFDKISMRIKDKD